MREMLARIRAVLRRSEKTATASEVLHAADIVLDKDRRTVIAGGAEVNLTPTEFDLLAVLMAEPGRVFSRAALLEAVQGIAFEGLERSINVHIRNLRTKIEPDPGHPRYIETVFGVGYRFAADSAVTKAVS
jgi:DNA-binding response OmpR family regulator